MIQIFTCLTGNSREYALHLKENLLSTSSSDMSFTALCDDTFTGYCPGWDIVDTVPRKYPNGAANHGQMLNKIRRHIKKNSSITVVADCDVAALRKGWDKLILSNMSDGYFDAMITPKFSGSPSVYFTALNSKRLKKGKPDFMPGTKHNGYLTDTPLVDTGWRLTEFFDRPYIYNYRWHPELRYLYSYGSLRMFSHMGGSHKKTFDSQETQNWIKAINKQIDENNRLNELLPGEQKTIP